MTADSHNVPELPGAVTLLDVAREAGVSPSTVSRILNGTAHVASDKRAAVENAIRKLNFTPNLFARSLKTGTTMTVGILTQDIESPFFNRAMRGIEEVDQPPPDLRCAGSKRASPAPVTHPSS